MSGKKIFVNKSNKDIEVTLHVRSGPNPGDQAGSQVVSIPVNKSVPVEYGNAQNIYLNGLTVTAVADGRIQLSHEFVLNRGCELDNRMNMNNCMTISSQGNGFVVVGSNT